MSQLRNLADAIVFPSGKSQLASYIAGRAKLVMEGGRVASCVEIFSRVSAID